MPVTITVSDSTRDAIRPKRPPRKKGESEEEYWDRLGKMHGPDRGEVDEGLDITDEEYEAYEREVPAGDEDEPRRDEGPKDQPQRRIGSKGLANVSGVNDEEDRRVKALWQRAVKGDEEAMEELKMLEGEKRKVRGRR